ncbi:hypothetical protein [Streptomyces acidiscabies]|uniref:Uncharacterized protein n=1 Tax=Streptomyces acidiscabies TaxID=42234 RepID=A0AAP6BL97_9ACTN|nr:hypothetical protein [Streptomyces acidiscabies]MBZ3917712.1 hypothetical protein [Streptomyces acidiscabies]MDX2966653.1 hypothetical protein [Streptomyces acidiscabies]MDX3025163.1 hypothetical protein [Streptomyces acidiscabies]MDX3796623.1 hypothetical protein [Streptomyces acidiscabies]
MSRRLLPVLGSHRGNGNPELPGPRAEARLPADNEQRWSSLPGHPPPDFDDLRHSRAQHPTRPDRDGHRGIGARDGVLHPRRAAGALAGWPSHTTGVPTEFAA